MKVDLKYFRDEFRVTTWLLIGACLQVLLLTVLPTRLAVAPAVVALTSRCIVFVFTRYGILPDLSLVDIRAGRTSTRLPRSDGSLSPTPAEHEMVVFVLGARSNQ